MTSIGKFFAAIRRQVFFNAIEREMKTKITPQIKGRADYGYPFSTSGELHKKRIEAELQFRETLHELDINGLQMPENECNALLYIAYRDLNDRVNTYLEYARTRKELRAPSELQRAAAAA
jgi:hypothetical protein